MKKKVAFFILLVIVIVFAIWKWEDLSSKFPKNVEEKTTKGFDIDTLKVIQPFFIERKSVEFLKAKYVGQNSLIPMPSGIITQVFSKPSHYYLKGEAILKLYGQKSDTISNDIIDIFSPCSCTILNEFKTGEKINPQSFLEIKNELSLYQVIIPKAIFETHPTYFDQIKGAIAPEMSILKTFDLKDKYMASSNMILSYSSNEKIDYLEKEVWLKVNIDFGIDYKLAKSAIRKINGEQFVLKVINNKLKQVKINVLSDSNNECLIRGDVSSSDQIVLNYTDSLNTQNLVFPVN